ncbi:MAG: manganese efflux pump MntP family protein [Paludibacteraceae bacterium]|nr:manganese efflux pump MntP family protein [Paludibacteraceae bacterium]HOI26619.1 manganese efflux pump MntP family protein [Paludibacteraceae bacterium]HPH63257.1 manganese efflux pump MntP family protein [Paludibacteraceae bacterium]
MDLITIILLAVALAMDCFAVSLANGIALKQFRLSPVLKMAFLFGLFQGMMPVFGWLLGLGFKSIVEQWDHWIALIILVCLGGKMIYESLTEKEDEVESSPALGWKSLVFLAIATSIDALATGLMFVSCSEVFLLAVIIIGVVSFIFSFAGNSLGIFFGKRFNFKVEILGGIVLIGIGIKIFLEHTLDC